MTNAAYVNACCPICAGSSTPHHALHGFAIDRCMRCGFVYVRNVPSEEALAADYVLNFGTAAAYVPEAKIGKRLKNWYLARRIAWFARAGQTQLLEIGFGPGHLLQALQNAGRFKVEGIDLAEASIAHLASLGLNVSRCTLWDKAYPDAGFDIVVGLHVLEHVQSLDLFLREIHRILRPGGRVFFQVPCVSHIRAVLAGKGWKHFSPPAHLWYFSRKPMQLLLSQHGFRVLRNHCLSNRTHLTVLAEKRPQAARAAERPALSATAAE